MCDRGHNRHVAEGGRFACGIALLDVRRAAFYTANVVIAAQTEILETIE